MKKIESIFRTRTDLDHLLVVHAGTAIPTHKIRRSFPVQAKSPPAPYPRPRSLRGHSLIDVMCTNLPSSPTLSLMPASGIVALSDASVRLVHL